MRHAYPKANLDIQILQRRSEWLRTRLQRAGEQGVDLSFDKRELASLTRVIEFLKRSSPTPQPPETETP